MDDLMDDRGLSLDTVVPTAPPVRCRGFVFALDPTKEQEHLFRRFAGARRFVFNWALAERKAFYTEHQKTLSAKELGQRLTALKHQKETAWLQEIDSQLLQSILDLAPGTSRRFLTYKCQDYGRHLVVVDPFFPSTKRCSHCHTINPHLTLKDREWTCATCGTHHDRDTNAALNLYQEGAILLNALFNRGTRGKQNAWGASISLSTAQHEAENQESPVFETGECQFQGDETRIERAAHKDRFVWSIIKDARCPFSFC